MKQPYSTKIFFSYVELLIVSKKK